MQIGSVLHLAAAAGLETSYTGFDGRQHQADEDVLRRLAAAVLSDSNGAEPDKADTVAPAVILRQGDPIPATVLPDPSVELELSDVKGRTVWRGRAGQVPAGLGCGEYRLYRPAIAKDAICRIFLSSLEAFQPAAVSEGRRIWLIAVQLYAVRSARNWGHGDFSDLAALLRLAATVGAGGIGLNPLHALFPVQPDEASPYSPSSRIFLNPLYIDPAAVPGFPGDERQDWDQELRELREQDIIDYSRICRLKFHVLRRCFDRFSDSRQPAEAADFARFREELGPDLRRFAAYSLLSDRYGRAWRSWPARWQAPDEDALLALAGSAPTDIAFAEFLQWQAHRQLESCRDLARKLGLPLGLYLDFAVGVHPDGFDVWSNPKSFVGAARLGAPPDLLNRGGQDWGLACLNPRHLQRHGYEPFRKAVRASMQFGGALRFDHVLGINRAYLIPEGSDARSGAYLRFPVEEMLAIMTCESVTRRCLIVGEDLGTVPEGLRDLLDRWGVWTYVILLFAQDENGAMQDPSEYPARALVAFNTHDLPTFAGWWQGRDLDAMKSAGLTLGETEVDRQRARDALAAALSAGTATPDMLDFPAVASFLARSPSGLLAVALEDLVGAVDQINLPGTWMEYPNWRRRLPVSLEALIDQPILRAVTAAMAAAQRDTVTNQE